MGKLIWPGRVSENNLINVIDENECGTCRVTEEMWEKERGGD